MNATFVTISGKLHVQTVMSRAQLMSAVREYMRSDAAWKTGEWCLADAEEFERAAKIVRETLRGETNTEVSDGGLLTKTETAADTRRSLD